MSTTEQADCLRLLQGEVERLRAESLAAAAEHQAFRSKLRIRLAERVYRLVRRIPLLLPILIALVAAAQRCLHGFRHVRNFFLPVVPCGSKVAPGTPSQRAAGPVRLPDHDRAGSQSFSSRFQQVPEFLLLKVNGSRDEQRFVKIGESCAECLAEHLPSPGQGRVLDFGCGLGRTLLHLRPFWPEVRLTGFDVDPVMLEWGRHLLHGHGIDLVGSTASLPDGQFDVIYAVSVFTHLHETAGYWLAEIHRLLKPSGKAFLTYHDETLFAEQAGTPILPETTKDSRCSDRYVIGRGTAEGGAGMAVYYMTAFWEETLRRYFHIDRTVPRGLRGYQSLSVVTPLSIRPDWHELRRQYVQALERELFSLRLRTLQMF